jgi:DNA-directed RNA polymerase I, II, and III subunit RPABC2
MSDIELSDIEDTKYDSEKEDNDIEIIPKKKSLVVDSDDEEEDEIDINEDSDVEPDINEDFDNDDELISNLNGKNKVSGKVENSGYDDNISPINSDVDSDDEDYLQKFDENIRKNFIENNHPECLIDNLHLVESLSKITRNNDGIIIDEYHKTVPFLTKYEKTRVIGQRIQQLNNGAKVYVNVSDDIIDNNVIAEMEIKEKKIPFIIRRPLPDNSFEYWKLQDLELID